MMIWIALATLFFLPGRSAIAGQFRDEVLPKVELRDAPLLQMRGADSASPEKPGECDCNNPGHWDGDILYVFNSAGHPWRSAGANLLQLQTNYARCEYDNQRSGGRWIEATWRLEDGTL